jgi:acyl carrier protein
MSEPTQIWQDVTKVFRELFGDDRLTVSETTTAADVDGWDSLTHIQLLLMIEQRFGIKFNTGEIAGMANVGALVKVIERRLLAATR